ncbi:ATP-dependent DNA helicase II subunit 1 [Abortiporus biennis]
MGAYDDWNKIDDDEDEELQDTFYETKKDVILFAIDCSESMLKTREDPEYEDVQTCHLLTALEAAMQIQKKKVITGPNDAVGIMFFNTTRKNEVDAQSSEIKTGNFVYQQIETINAPKIQELIHLIDAAREDPNLLRETFPPIPGGRVPMGDVFTSCNWIIRDGAPKTASKRVFLITDEDDPNPGPGKERLLTTAKTTLIDLTQAGIMVEPFFISTEEKPFDQTVFYSSVLLPNGQNDDEGDSSILPESISITRIDDLLAQMRFHESPKRALFSIPFQLADGFVIGVKGYGLVVEQKKGSYIYFYDTNHGLEPVTRKSAYYDEETDQEVPKAEILYGFALAAAENGDNEDEEQENDRVVGMLTRKVPVGSRVFYTDEEVRSFRTMGLEPGIKLLGFKDRSELAFEDNIKRSTFIYPDEMSYSGSKRTFSALLHAMIKKDKIGLVLALTRRNSSPIFCALLPQEEKDEDGWNEPAGFHLIPLPFADDIRAAPIESGHRASKELRDAALKWVNKLSVKNGTYPPDSYPNPALAYHNAQLEASAFREEFDEESFEDLTLPKYSMIRKRAGPLLKEWRQSLVKADNSLPITEDIPVETKKRKSDTPLGEIEVREMYESSTLSKLRVDQMKMFLKAHGMSVSGKKADLEARIAEFLDTN